MDKIVILSIALVMFIISCASAEAKKEEAELKKDKLQEAKENVCGKDREDVSKEVREMLCR